MKESYMEDDYAHYWLEKGIIHEIFKPGLEIITIEIAKQMVESRLKVTNGIYRPLFIDLNNAISIDKKSRQYWANGDATKYVTATGILLDNEIARFWVSTYIKIDKPIVPTRFFTEKENALKWLETFKYQN
jgi:hypothetical protein